MIAERKNITETKTITDKKLTLEEMQEFVGGLIELVYLKNGDHLIINEEGILLELSQNHEASEIAGQMILGNALILKGKARLE
jgi:hypothetical protein